MLKWFSKSIDDLDGKDALEMAAITATVFIPQVAIPCWMLFGACKAAKPTAKGIGYVAKKAFTKKPPKPVPPPPPPTLEELVQQERDEYLRKVEILSTLPLSEAELRAAGSDLEASFLRRIEELLG